MLHTTIWNFQTQELRRFSHKVQIYQETNDLQKHNRNRWARYGPRELNKANYLKEWDFSMNEIYTYLDLSANKTVGNGA